MAMISKELINEIRTKANIVDIIAEYLPLTQRGRNYFALCPFHNDHNPSLSISPEKQIYTCFVCGESGNVFNFIMNYEHLNFGDAVRLIADKVGVVLPVSKYKQVKINSAEQRLYEIYNLSSKYYQNYLNTKSGEKAREYLNKRNFTPAIIAEFKLGLAPFGNELSKLLLNKSFTEAELKASGISNINNKEVTDVFRNRIMFPLWNLEGQVVGFSGRIYTDVETAKYINSRESNIFKKGELLYNYQRARNEIRRQKQVIIVEGFMDVIVLYQHNIKNVVATMGTAITKEQALLIKKLAPQVILCFDGDEAGAVATINCGRELGKIGVIPGVIRLGQKLDPDDYIKKEGVTAFLKQIATPIPFLNYQVDYLKKGKNFNDPVAISLYIEEVVKILIPLKDEVIRELILQKVSAETNVSLVTIKSTFNTILNKSKEQQGSAEIKVKPKRKRLSKYEQAQQRMLFYMLHDPGVIKIYTNHGCHFPQQDARYLANEIVYFYKKYKSLELADFFTYLGEKADLIKLTNNVLALSLPEQYIAGEIDDYVQVLKEYVINLKLETLKTQFKAENDLEKKSIIANQIIEIKKGVKEND